jgi:hypothetical protein
MYLRLPAVQAAPSSDDWRGSTESGSSPAGVGGGSPAAWKLTRLRMVIGETTTGFVPAIARALRTFSAWASRFSTTSVSVNAWICGVIEKHSASHDDRSGRLRLISVK